MTTTRGIAAEARELPREPTARWIRALALVATVAWAAVLAWQVVALPERVPTSFGVTGEPREWSSRGEALAFAVLLPLAAAFPLPLMSLLALHYPSAINAPNREWWTATAPRLRRFERMIREDLWLIAIVMLGLFTAIQVGTTRAALAADDSGGGSGCGAGCGSGSDALFGVGMVVFLVLTVAVVVRIYAGRYAEQPDLG